MIFQIVIKSILNRRLSTFLTISSIALSVTLLLSVERIRTGAKEGFTSTISSTDLIVGAKGSPINLLLYTVFHLGTPMENIPWSAYQDIKSNKDIDWTIPISLGDSHGAYRVVGTDDNFYQHYRYGNDQEVAMEEGKKPFGPRDAVLGYDVAKELKYSLNSKITLSHGAGGGVSFHNHDDLPFKVVGILKKTGTPLDRSLYITLAGIELLHEGWEDGAPPMKNQEHEDHEHDDHGHDDHGHDDHGDNEHTEGEETKIEQISAFLLKTKSRIGALHLQREINQYKNSPMLAILPGITLSELWKTLSYVEKSLSIISFLVVLIGLMSMLISIYNSLNERRREIAIFRSLGASPAFIFSTLILEALVLSGMGIAIAVTCTNIVLSLSHDWLIQEFSVNLNLPFLSLLEGYYLLSIWFFSGILGFIPAARAYFRTLSDGLTIKI